MNTLINGSLFSLLSSPTISKLEEIYDQFAENTAMILLNMRSRNSWTNKHVDNCYIHADRLTKEVDSLIKISGNRGVDTILPSLYRYTYELAANVAQ